MAKCEVQCVVAVCVRYLCGGEPVMAPSQNFSYTHLGGWKGLVLWSIPALLALSEFHLSQSVTTSNNSHWVRAPGDGSAPGCPVCVLAMYVRCTWPIKRRPAVCCLLLQDPGKSWCPIGCGGHLAGLCIFRASPPFWRGAGASWALKGPSSLSAIVQRQCGSQGATFTRVMNVAASPSVWGAGFGCASVAAFMLWVVACSVVDLGSCCIGWGQACVWQTDAFRPSWLAFASAAGGIAYRGIHVPWPMRGWFPIHMEYVMKWRDSLLLRIPSLQSNHTLYIYFLISSLQ